MSAILKNLVKHGLLSERIYGREDDDGESTPAADAKLDKDSDQVLPGSPQEDAAEADDTANPDDDAEADAKNGDSSDPTKSGGVTVEAPVTFLSMTLMGAAGMVEALEGMTAELVARYGDTALPVFNDIVFKVRSANEMLKGLVEASNSPDDGSGDDNGDDTDQSDGEDDGGDSAEGDDGADEATSED